MKKILTLAAAVVGFAFAANAQRDCDVLTILNKPAVDPVTTLHCAATDSLLLDFHVVNLGPDNLLKNDTLWLLYPGSDVGFVGGYILDTTLVMNDSIHFVFKLGYNEVKKLNDASDGTEVAKASFVSGTTYGCVIGIDHFGSIDGQEITDADGDNNFDVGGVKVDCTTGINGLAKNNSSLNVFPNPANNQISFTNNFATATTANVRITDIAGRVVKSMNLGKQNAGTKTYSVDISDLNNGMYYIELVTESTRSISKFTKN